MLAKPFARLMDRNGIHYGWVMVALTFLTQLSTASAMGIAGVPGEPVGQGVRLEHRGDQRANGIPAGGFRRLGAIRGGVHPSATGSVPS